MASSLPRLLDFVLKRLNPLDDGARMRHRWWMLGPPFDHELAKQVVGKHVLVGLTYLRHDGTLDRHEQVHGLVTKADEETIEIKLAGTDEPFTLPPDLRSLQTAAPGEYRLRSTGEVIINPDYLMNWTVNEPPPL